MLDGRDQAHAAAAARTHEHVEAKGAAHQIGPGPVAGFAGSLALQDWEDAGQEKEYSLVLETEAVASREVTTHPRPAVR
jgi:hypothetical protein